MSAEGDRFIPETEQPSKGVLNLRLSSPEKPPKKEDPEFEAFLEETEKRFRANLPYRKKRRGYIR